MNVKRIQTTNLLYYNLEYKLQQNELLVNDGLIGIFEPDPNPVTFLSTASPEKTFDGVESLKRNNLTYPYLNFIIEMSDNKVVITRQAYSIFDILGDFGGFNGSIFMILSTVFTAYSARIYHD